MTSKAKSSAARRLYGVTVLIKGDGRPRRAHAILRAGDSLEALRRFDGLAEEAVAPCGDWGEEHSVRVALFASPERWVEPYRGRGKASVKALGLYVEGR